MPNGDDLLPVPPPPATPEEELRPRGLVSQGRQPGGFLGLSPADWALLAGAALGNMTIYPRGYYGSGGVGIKPLAALPALGAIMAGREEQQRQRRAVGQLQRLLGQDVSGADVSDLTPQELRSVYPELARRRRETEEAAGTEAGLRAIRAGMRQQPRITGLGPAPAEAPGTGASIAPPPLAPPQAFMGGAPQFKPEAIAETLTREMGKLTPGGRLAAERIVTPTLLQQQERAATRSEKDEEERGKRVRIGTPWLEQYRGTPHYAEAARAYREYVEGGTALPQAKTVMGRPGEVPLEVGPFGDVRQIPGAAVPERSRIPAEHERLFEEWRREHPEGTYSQFYQENIRPSRQPTYSDEQLRAISLGVVQDPRMSAADARRILRDKEQSQVRVSGGRSEAGYNARLTYLRQLQTQAKAGDPTARQALTQQRQFLMNQASLLQQDMRRLADPLVAQRMGLTPEQVQQRLRDGQNSLAQISEELSILGEQAAAPRAPSAAPAAPGARPQAGRAPKMADVNAARRDAKGDPRKAVELLRRRGFDPNLEPPDYVPPDAQRR